MENKEKIFYRGLHPPDPPCLDFSWLVECSADYGCWSFEPRHREHKKSGSRLKGRRPRIRLEDDDEI